MNFYETLTPQTYIRTQYLCFLQSSGMCLRAKFIIRSDLSSPCKLATCTETWGQIQNTENVFTKKNCAICVIRYVRLVVSSIFFLSSSYLRNSFPCLHNSHATTGRNPSKELLIFVSRGVSGPRFKTPDPARSTLA